jgi:gamma-glutamyl hercynylcysteine S-oxide synthase
MQASSHARDAAMTDPRRLAGDTLAAALRESRARTWSLVDDLTDAQWRPAPQAGVNPIAWELAHLAWFAEFWTLRGSHARDAHGHALGARPPRFAAPDALFDSARLAHGDRWRVALPSRSDLTHMLVDQLEATIDALPPGDDDAALYFHRLALFHEDMHGEAFCWLRSALGLPVPRDVAMPHVAGGEPLHIRGGEVRLGRVAALPGFAFDNELPGRTVTLRDFEIDSAPVVNAAFASFVEAGGYDDPRWWPGEAGTWRAQSPLSHPPRWRRDARGAWQLRWFDAWLPLPPDAPVMHISAFEAEAFCRWAGRRLASAAEWEHAAASEPSFTWGASVWEWTRDTFAPYPGFAPGPYREYSEPWFDGAHRELRGGAFTTHTRLLDARYRNFFQPHRTDIFAGLRTVAL